MVSSIMPTYGRPQLAFERGEGVYLFSANGKRFLDFGAGIAVASLGHCHPHLIEALEEQARKLIVFFLIILALRPLSCQLK